MSKWHGGKGSKRRPEDTSKYNDNWDRIFKSKNQKDKQREVTDLNWDGDDEENTKDSIPQNSFRPR